MGVIYITMNSPQMFSSKQTCDIVDITYRQLDYWARTGLFCPTFEAHGSGSRRKYSFKDLVSLRVIKNMLDSGMNLQDVRRATDYLSTQEGDIANADLVMNGNEVFLNDSSQPQALFDLVKNGQGVFTIVALSKATEHVASGAGVTINNKDADSVQGVA